MIFILFLQVKSEVNNVEIDVTNTTTVANIWMKSTKIKLTPNLVAEFLVATTEYDMPPEKLRSKVRR